MLHLKFKVIIPKKEIPILLHSHLLEVYVLNARILRGIKEICATEIHSVSFLSCSLGHPLQSVMSVNRNLCHSAVVNQ